MTAYLDNNIVIYIEEGKIILPESVSIIYPFSSVHIEELLESGDKLKILKEKRLDTLTSLSNDNYLYTDNDANYEIVMCNRSPYMVFGDFYNNPMIHIIREEKKKCSNNMKDSDELIKYLGVNIKDSTNEYGKVW